MTMQEGVFIIGNGQITALQGPRGKTPECPDALFKKRDVVKVRRLITRAFVQQQSGGGRLAVSPGALDFPC